MPLCAQCPAARHVHGVTPSREGVTCGVLLLDRLRADKVLDGDLTPYMAVGTDPSIVQGFCCGSAMPALTIEQAKGPHARAHYSYCPIWQAERDAAWARKARAFEGRERYRQPESMEDVMSRLEQDDDLDEAFATGLRESL